MSFEVAELDRRVANTILTGTVLSVDGATARATVDLGGDLDTIEIPVGQLRAGGFQIYAMPEPGEQVAIAAPSGDLANAFVFASVFQGNAQQTDAAIPTMVIPGKLKIVGDIEMEGTLTVTSGDVIAEGISLTTHKHTGVTPGASLTGGPA